MKITKQGRFLPHPCPEKRQNVSGVQELDGEDLDFDSRQAYLKAQQKAALDDQIREKNMRKQMEDQEDYQYAAQTNQITRMRGMLDDDFKAKKQHMEKTTKEYNKI